MKNRCLVNQFGYCVGEPEYKEEPVLKPIIDPHTGKDSGNFIKVGGECKLLPNDCGKFSSFNEQSKDTPHFTETLKEIQTLKEKPVNKPEKKQVGLQGDLF